MENVDIFKILMAHWNWFWVIVIFNLGRSR